MTVPFIPMNFRNVKRPNSNRSTRCRLFGTTTKYLVPGTDQPVIEVPEHEPVHSKISKELVVIKLSFVVQ